MNKLFSNLILIVNNHCKMKNINMFLLLFLIPSFVFGQELKIEKETGRYTKSEVIEFDNISKKELFNRAIEWITINYTSVDDVMQLKDDENGKIILKGNFSIDIFFKQGWIKHTLILDFKDDRFRYTYTNLSYYSPGSGDIPFEGSMVSKKKILAITEANIDNSMSSLVQYILSEKSKDDW